MRSSHLVLLMLFWAAFAGLTTAQPRPMPMPEVRPPVAPEPPTRPILPPPVIASQVAFHSEQTSVVVEGAIARIEHAMVFRNHGRGDGEGTFLLPMPKGAVFDSMEIIIDGKKVGAEVLDAKDAREAYEAVVRAARDPALLEYVDATTVRLRMFPVPPGGDFPVTLRYVVPLEERGRFHELAIERMRPVATTAPGESRLPGASKGDLEIRIMGRGSNPLLASPTHEYQTRVDDDEIVVSIAPDSGPRRIIVLIGSEQENESQLGLELVAVPPSNGETHGTFMLMVRPPNPEGDAIPRTVTFVLDVSGSMNWENRIAQARNALQQAIMQLRPSDYFNIILFSTGTTIYSDIPLRATEENKNAAASYIAGVPASGGTNIEGALARALQQKAPTDLHQVLFITDGEPTVGTRSVPQLIQRVRDGNTGGLRVFTLGIGYDVNVRLLDGIAAETRAVSGYITPDENLELRLGSFLAAVAEPTLTDVELIVEGMRIADVVPSPLPDLFAGNTISLIGRYDGAFEGSIAIRGKQGDDIVEQRIEATPSLASKEAGYIERLWASRMIGHLLDAHRRGDTDGELRAEILRLGNKYGIVTPFTSALAIDDSEMPGAPPRPQPALADTRDLPIPDVVITDRGTPQRAGAPERFDASWRIQDRGERGVAQSRQIARMRDGAIAHAPSSGGEQIRFVCGRAFQMANGVWTEEALPKDLSVIEVEFLGATWWQLIEQPELREILALGERVRFRHEDVIVQIGETESSEAAGLVD